MKTKARRYFSVEKRDLYGLTCLERIQLKKIFANISLLLKIKRDLDCKRGLQAIKNRVILAIVEFYTRALNIIVVDIPEKPIKVVYPPMTFEIMESHLLRIGVTVSDRFRFTSMDQLRRILHCFNFPTAPFSYKTYLLFPEEALLISIYRLSWPLKWSQLYEVFPGRKRWFLCAAFYWFLDFMIVNWSYLLLNNMEWWEPYLVTSAECMRVKLANLNHIPWRQFHLPATELKWIRYWYYY
jgi:hypothetical protein